jgi:predicted alpha/beta hydrolase
MVDEKLVSPVVERIALRIPALDGFMLGATHYRIANLESPPTVVLFSCGGGIPAARYSRFARYLAANGIPVLTYDYRGIDSSRTSNLRGFKAVAEDWSESDCGGAIAHLREQYPKAEMVGIAHSIGALLIGGAPNVNVVRRFVFVCAHTGYFADYMPMYRLPMAVLWHGVMPALTRLLGYFPARSFRLGEDIPAGVAMQWAARRSPEFRPETTDPMGHRANAMIARYRSVRGRVLAIGFTDDAFATPAGTNRLLNAFPALQATPILISPRQAGMAKIGHFGFFRRKAEPRLWTFVVNFLRTSECVYSPAAPLQQN